MAGIDKDMYSFWETVKYTRVYGLLSVPRIGANEGKNAPRFKHNAATRSSRYGDSGTELAFELIGFLSDNERLPPDPYVWIPLDCRTTFRDEGLCLVPLLKIEEMVTREGGAVRLKNTRYELLPGRFPVPRIQLNDKPYLLMALKEWSALSNLPDGEDTRTKKAAFLKKTLENSYFGSMHACSMRELQQLGVTKEPLSEQDAKFWSERMLSTYVYRQARQEIGDLLTHDFRKTSFALAQFVIQEAAEYCDSSSSVPVRSPNLTQESKTNTVAGEAALHDLSAACDIDLLHRKRAILASAFFAGLKDIDIQIKSADILAEVYQSKLKDTLMAWIEVPETRMVAIEAGRVLQYDVEFAQRATRYFAECEAVKVANDSQGIRLFINENRWIEMRHVMRYLITPGNSEGDKIVRQALEATPPGTSQVCSLIEVLIQAKDNRFLDSVCIFAGNVLNSENSNVTSELYAALAYLAMWNHPDAKALSVRCFKEKKPSDYQIRMFKQYLSRVTAQLGSYREFETPQDCLEWINMRGENN